MDLQHSVHMATVRTQRVPIAATAPQVMWQSQAPHTVRPRRSEGSLVAAIWKWLQM